jgi:hypothetical protein
MSRTRRRGWVSDFQINQGLAEPALWVMLYQLMLTHLVGLGGHGP